MFWNLGKPRSIISVTNLNDTYINTVNDVRLALGMKAKEFLRKRSARKIFVIDFNGDVMASQAKALTYEITSVLFNAGKDDTVLVRLQSPGGAAHAYGFAASQLERLKKAGIYTVVAIDKIAASGGAMMSVVSDKIIAAPFAIVGSIGVVAEFPNFNNFLENLGIDYRQYTAGKHKRTITPMGKITEEGEKKFNEDLINMYDLFKNHIKKYRPQIDLDLVATGEHWSAINAVKLGLVDEIKTSEEYILDNVNDAEIILIQYVGDKKSWIEKLGTNLMYSFWEGMAKTFWKTILELSVRKYN